MKQEKNNPVQIEAAILGFFIEDGSFSLGNDLTEIDFTDNSHKIIFKSLQNITKQGFKIEVPILIQDLSEKDQFFKLGEYNYLFKLINSSALKSNVPKFIELLKQKTKQRKKIQEIKNNINLVSLTGKVVNKPKTFSRGKLLCSKFVIAIKRSYDLNKIDYIPIIAWRDQAKYASDYLKKDMTISLKGNFSSSNFKTSDGELVTSYDVTARQIKILDIEKQLKRENYKNEEMEI